MAINFDPELMKNIKIIYGDANLDNKVLKLLYKTWKTNPNIIRNTALQKMPELKQASFNIQSTMLPNALKMRTQEIADDDLSGVRNFNTAFREANNRELKQFKWKNTKANPSGMFTTELAVKSKETPTESKELSSTPTKGEHWDNALAGTNLNSPISYRVSNTFTTLKPQKQLNVPLEGNNEFVFNSFENKNPRFLKDEQRSYQYRFDKAFDEWYESQNPRNQSWYNWMNPQWREYNRKRDTARQDAFNRINAKSFLQGGQMNSLQQEMQKKFIQFLVQDALKLGVQIQSEQDLQKYVQSLGEQGLKAKLLEFIQAMLGGVMARFGAKLGYLKKLKGICPEGEELIYFKLGGRICKACQKVLKGTRITESANEADKFKTKRAQYKRDMKVTKDEASRDSIAINKYNDLEVMANKGHKGNFKNGKWIPDRTKYAKKNACGSKIK